MNQPRNNVNTCVLTKELQANCPYSRDDTCPLTMCMYYHDEAGLYFGELSKHILTGYKLDRNTCTLYFDKIAPKIVILDNTITIRRLADLIEDCIDDLEPYTNYERLIRVNTLHKNSKGQLLGRIVNIKGEDIQIELDKQITTYSFEKLVEYIMLWHRKDNMPQCYITNPSKLKGLYSREHLVHRLKKELYKVCLSNALN